ncbi:unnamed protein product [Closterium sp. NIES-53]
MFGASLAPPDTADSATRSQWLTCDAAARLAVRNHLPLAERAHFGQHRTAKALYDALDLITHLRTSDTCYRAALKAEFLDKNPPPMYITLYFIVTRLPEFLRAVRDHFLALDPTYLTIDLLEKHLLAAETSRVAVGAARGTPRTPFFEGCSPSPLASSYASAAAVDILGTKEVGAAFAPSGKHRSGKGKGGKSGGGGSGGCGGGGGGRDGGWSGGGSGCFGGGSGSGGGRVRAVQRGGSSGGQRHQQQRPSETPTPQQLREWFAQRGASGGSVHCLSGVDIFALDYDAILAAMCALTVSAEGDCYLCVLPDPGIEAAALGASDTTLTPLPAPVPVRLADPLGGPVLAGSFTVLPCPAVPSGTLSGLHLPSFSMNLVSTAALQDAMVTTTTTGGQRVAICTCIQMGRYLATFTHRIGSSLYTLTTEPAQVAASGQVLASGQVAAAEIHSTSSFTISGPLQLDEACRAALPQ